MIQNTSGKFHTVKGFVSESERIALQHCVLTTATIPGDCVEVGSLNGLSALLTMTVMGSGKTLYCVELNQVDSLRGVVAMWQFMVGAHNVQIINQDFRNVPFEDTHFSFVFIDHSHGYKDNIDAFEKFWPKVSPGGILSFHDYQDPNWQEGTRAIDWLIEKYRLGVPLRGGSFIAFKK